MKRMILMTAVLAVAACGRPGEDDYEETVYDRNNPPSAQPSASTTGGAAGTGTAGATGAQRDSMNTRFDSLSRLDSLRRDSLRLDSLRQDSLRRRGTIRRDTTPQ